MAKEDPNHNYFFKVLQEQVAVEDLFEDKTHQKVANTLETVIDTTEQGLTIGLEGSWGSGKSTVINLLRKKLDEEESEKKTLFFAFDAWAHDGDPLRKIFLESLITSIDPDGSDEKLNDLKNDVSARKKTVQVKTKKSASNMGKWLSISALPIPVGAALLTTVKYDKLLSPFHSQAGSPNLTFLFGLLLSFMPLVFLAIWWKWGDKDPKTNKTKWDFLESDSEESYTQDVTEDGERTSIEFEKFFNEIMFYVFDPESDYQYEQAIIVIDNLDRVEPDYAQNVWSTLQTFFQHRTSSLNNQINNWQNKLWFLIPFDREGIKKVWQASDIEDDTQNSKAMVADSFMEKCFQVTIEVPPPVMSAWIEYFKQSVQKSFTGWPSNQRNEFIESYIQCMSKLDISPSPRQIHTHINRAGVIALHNAGAVSAESVSLYSLCRQSFSENEFRKELLKDGIPNDFPNLGEVSKLKAELAGILFGVDPNKGVQLLLSPEIRKAISEGDGEFLKELEDTHRAAFWLALRASSNEWIVTDSHIDEYKINAVNAIFDAFGDSNQYLTPFIARINNAFLQSFDNWKLSDYSYREALEKLLKLINDKESFLQKLQVKFKNKLRRVVNEIDSEKFPKHELESLTEIETILREENHPLRALYYKKLDINNWQKWLEHSESYAGDLKSVLPDKATFNQLIGGAGFNVATLNKNVFDALVTTFHKTTDKIVWKDLPSSLIAWFNLNNRNIEADDQYSLAISLLSNVSSSNLKALKECVAGSAFWQRAAHSEPSKNPSLPFLVALTVPNFRDNQYVSLHVKNFLNEKLEVKQIEEAYKYFSSAGDLIAIWKLAKEKQNIFARQILNTITDKNLFSIGARYVDEVLWEDECESAAAIEKLCKNGAIEAIEESIEEDPIGYCKTIRLLQEYGDDQAKEFVSRLLISLNREQWFEAFTDADDLLGCVPEQSSAFSKAWTEYITDIVTDKINEPEDSLLKSHFELKDKVLDLETIHGPSITTKYFENKNADSLSDEGFSILSSLFLPSMKDVPQQDYEIRLSHWIDANKTSRIQWLLSAELNTALEPIESVIAGVKTQFLHTTGEDREIYEKLNDKLNLKIDLSSIQDDDEESSESEVLESEK